MKRPGAMLGEVLSHIFKKPATELYPFEKIEKPADYRGKLKFFPEKCIGCKLCVKDCPSNAIVITKVGDKLFDCEIFLDRCIFCGQCVFICPKQALVMTKDFELADTDRSRLKVTYHAKVKPENTDPK